MTPMNNDVSPRLRANIVRLLIALLGGSGVAIADAHMTGLDRAYAVVAVALLMFAALFMVRKPGEGDR